jgi:hypothetical protein
METAGTSTPSYGFRQFVRNLLIKLDKICQPTRSLPTASPAGRVLSPCWQHHFPHHSDRFSPACVHNLLRRDGPGLSRQWPALLPSPALSAAGGALLRNGSRTSGVPATPGRAAVSGPACTALMRQGRSVARAAGPRHRRPRLRHETHRRGHASAASRPLKAHARVVETVCQSAQPPADRSVQRLVRRRRWTAPADCWAARRRSGPPEARQRARMDAAPCLSSLPPRGHSGWHRRRCAPPVPLLPFTPHPPLEGFAARCAPGGKRLCRSCLPLCFLSSLLTRLRNRRRGALSHQDLARLCAPSGYA